MPTPAQTPKLPALPFLAGDAALLAAAWVIGDQAARPLSETTVLAIAACVVCAGVAGAIPFLVNHARREQDAVDDRQRSLEALSRTIGSAGEQIGIAAQGLQEVAAEFKRSLQESAEAARAKEAEERRAAEAEEEESAGRDERLEELTGRLEAAADKFAKNAGDLAKVRAAAATAEAEQAAAREEKLGRLLERFETAAGKLGDVASELARLEASQKRRAARVETAAAAKPVHDSAKEAPAAEQAGAQAESSASAPKEAPTEPPKTREAAEAAPSSEATRAPGASGPAPAESASNGSAAERTGEMLQPAQPSGDEKPGERTARLAVPASESEIERASPTSDAGADSEPAEKRAPPHDRETEAALVDPKPKSPRKSKAMPIPKPEPDSLFAPDEFSQVGPEEREQPPAVSADGATRLIVTAYIGIGNRLFIRGEGPGLSPDKGVPLQFMSIGKWRWETADAAAPIRYRLFKNDEVECASLGERTLEPGRQQEIAATF